MSWFGEDSYLARLMAYLRITDEPAPQQSGINAFTVDMLILGSVRLYEDPPRPKPTTLEGRNVLFMEVYQGVYNKIMRKGCIAVWFGQAADDGLEVYRDMENHAMDVATLIVEMDLSDEATVEKYLAHAHGIMEDVYTYLSREFIRQYANCHINDPTPHSPGEVVRLCYTALKAGEDYAPFEFLPYKK